MGTAVKGLGFAPLLTTSLAMIADTVEYGQWKTGHRTEGLINSSAGFGMKLGTGIGTIVLSAVLALGHYDVTLGAAQPASALTGFQFLIIFFPMILGLLGVVVLYFFDLDKHYDTIVKELEERQAN